MNNKEQDNYNNATLDLIKKFIDSNQRKRINSLTQIESEVENILILALHFLISSIIMEMTGLPVGYCKF